MEVCFAIHSSFLAHFQFEGSVRQCCVRWLSTTLAFQRFCGLRGFASWAFQCSSIGHRVLRETAQTAKAWPFSVPASRGRAPAVTCNNQHDARAPPTSRQKQNAETRDLGLKTCGVRARALMCLQPAVARLVIPLAASYQGLKRALSTVADSAGARPRKMVTGRMANFDRFLLFSASLECKQKVALGQWPKTAEIDQASEGQSCGQPPHTTLSDSVP